MFELNSKLFVALKTFSKTIQVHLTVLRFKARLKFKDSEGNLEQTKTLH